MAVLARLSEGRRVVSRLAEAVANLVDPSEGCVVGVRSPTNQLRQLGPVDPSDGRGVGAGSPPDQLKQLQSYLARQRVVGSSLDLLG